jgi:ribosome biogenesis GTPase
MERPELPATGQGLVVALQANFCRVSLDRPGPGGVRQLLCTRRTRLGKSGTRICAGDRVRVEAIDWSAGRGAVGGLEPRSNQLKRPSVANVDRMVVVVSLSEPALDPLQLTRFLITAEGTGRPVELVLTKADLLPAAAVREWCERVAAWGYPVHAVSIRSGEGVEDLRRSLSRTGIAVLCGPSGVGKSSLLNALVPELALRVAAVSGRLQRGRHTTRHVELFPLGERSLVADTPGFNQPELPADPAALAASFPELRERLAAGDCRFRNCRHRGDPGCTAGTDWLRYPQYLQCLAEVEGSAFMVKGRGREREVGFRNRGGGQEPLLDAQQRQSSRRRSRQELEAEISPPSPADSGPVHR